MVNIKSFLRQLGGNMLELTWGNCLQFSFVSTGIAVAYLAILGFVQGVFQSDAIWLFVTLFQVTIIVSLVILAFAAFVKFITFILGRFFLWIAKDRRERRAKITTMSVCVENKYLLVIQNDEFWLRADDVFVNSKFVFDFFSDRQVNKNIKWMEDSSEDGKTSISRRKYKVLHVATLEDDKLILNMIGGDEIFPFPNTILDYYTIPFYINGSMSFLGFEAKSVHLLEGGSILIYNDKTVKIR